MSNYQQVWTSLEDDEYRREYAADVGTGLAFQIKMLRDKNGWTQAELGERAGGKRQETISQWENPNYGKYSLSTIKDLAVAFDVGLVVRFAPFSEVVEWTSNLTPESLAPPSFTEEQQSRRVPVVQSYEMHTGEPETNVASIEGVDRLLSFTATIPTLPFDEAAKATFAWVSATTTAEPKESERALAA